MSIPLFDCHCDTIVEAAAANAHLRSNSLQLDLERLSRYSPCAQVFAVCTEIEHEPQAPAEQMLMRLNSELCANGDIVRLCLTADDIDLATAEGKIAAFISVEGAEQLTTLERAYSLGVRCIHPTWNFENRYCGAALAGGGGLTDAGRDLVMRAQEIGILLDMSHISEAGFYDVVAISRKPVIAGHSNSAAVMRHKRNLTDAQFTELVKCGGGAGVNLYPDFLGGGKNIASVVSHIEHFLSLGGRHSVFLGCDFDGVDSLPDGITGVQDLEKLYCELLRRNFSEDCVRDIFWNNLYNIFRRAL
ncbi:MAG: membrane dipeptidase [Oscillospiraceae bacterium]|nr:membrane dipeptidase [Oscillospiraceae bacterium]